MFCMTYIHGDLCTFISSRWFIVDDPSRTQFCPRGLKKAALGVCPRRPQPAPKRPHPIDKVVATMSSLPLSSLYFPRIPKQRSLTQRPQILSCQTPYMPIFSMLPLRVLFMSTVVVVVEEQILGSAVGSERYCCDPQPGECLL